MSHSRTLVLCLATAFALSLHASLPPSSVSAQEATDACPALVERALTLASDSCADLGRNEACYGHNLVTATTWEEAELSTFDAPGDTTDVLQLASLATFPLDVEEAVWGVALLSLQADLAETLPGQAVTFVVFGDAELTSEVPPADQAAPPPTCTATASGGLNLRAGPGTGYAIAGGLAAGDAITVNGRSEAGDWLRVDLADAPAWVYAPLVALDCEVETLAAIAADAAAPSRYSAPMQAFSLRTGFGEPACEEAPRDGLLVQAPQDTVVHFRINGVEVEVGSTGLLFVDGDTLTANTFDGTVAVTSAGETQTAEPGFRISAEAGAPPTEPEPYPYEEVRAAPVQLLPEPVTIPLIVPGTSDWVESGVTVRAGQTFIVRTGGAVNPCINFDLDVCYPHGPEGIVELGTTPDTVNMDTQGGPPYPLPEGRVGALIGRIGTGEPFAVGAGGTRTADADGSLQFRINDNYLDNNEGAFIVIVELEEQEP